MKQEKSKCERKEDCKIVKTIKFVSLFLTLVFICSFVLLEPAVAKAEEYYEVTAGTLNLREKATTKSTRIGRLSRP